MKRKAYLRLRERYRRRKKDFVYVDESGFEPAVVRRYGRASRGQKVYGLRPGNSRPRTCFLAAKIDGTLQATQLWEGTCNTHIFNQWLEESLCPVLNENHVVVMDNAAFHKSNKTQELIEQAGATLLFLPPYSPDFNPIEHDFAAIKKRREFHEHKTIDRIIKDYN
jgi:hypothetical protein